MKRIVVGKLNYAFVLAVCGGLSIIPPVSYAQSAGKTLSTTKTGIDAHNLANGYRASKIIGASIYNDSNDAIGKVDDIVTSLDEHENYLVLAVGGFLGLGSKLVVMPYQDLKIINDKLVLSGATKEALKSLPAFQYAP